MAQTHVLFVEDEDLIRVIVAESLAEAGIAVTEACSGEAAVELLREQGGFDVLLTDVHMRGRLSGVDVARHVRSLWPQMPVVFVTGRPDALHEFGVPGPHDHCVLKPYRPADVIAAIEASLVQATE